MEPNALSLSTITVDTLRDELDGDMSAGDVSLREAIAAAAADSVITFDQSLAQGTIRLSLGELAIDKNLTIVGLGADQLTINGRNQSSIFRIDDGTTETAIDVAIEGLKLTRGAQDGAIVLEGEDLTLENSEISGSSVGITVNRRPYYYSIDDSTGLTVRDSTIANNKGAGIVGAEDIRIIDSAILNNDGDGVDFNGEATVTRSRISGNRGNGLNSADYQYGLSYGTDSLTVTESVITGNAGKGIGAFANITVTDSRITDNTDDGIDNVNGIFVSSYNYYNGGSVSVTGTTVENNGGNGISSFSGGTITNSTISNNSKAGVENGSYYGRGGFTLNNSSVTKNSGDGISTFSSYGFRVQLNNSSVIENVGSGVATTGSRYGGTITANNSVIANNSGSGLFSSGGRGGSATLRDSTISGHSGVGVLADYVTVERSTIENSGGVGLTFTAGATVTSSTLSGNEGGGIFRRERYAGYYYGTQLLVKNSTISGNGGDSAEVGGIENINSQEYYTHTTRIENSTISGNTGTEVGGIKVETTGSYNEQEAFVKNTIVAKNNGSTSDVSGEFDSLGYNLVGDGTGATGFDSTGDLVGTSDSLLNPRLGALKDNGGPTKTQLLLAGSIAVDAGAPSGSFPDFDQRGEGFVRIIDGDNDGVAQVDIGAVEVLPARNVINGNRLNNRLVGTNQADLIRGFAGNDSLIGRGGDDVLEGRAGVDRLIGGEGRDRLNGGVGNDKLIGGGGNDLLIGEVGNDQLKGGSGEDTFAFLKSSEGKDTILDFQIGTDKIDVSAILNNTAYNSLTPFTDYIRIGQSGRRNSTISILDARRSGGGREVFRDLALVRNVMATELDESSFLL